MGLIKTICLRIALNKEQRLVIWNALAYSDHTYRRRGNIERAVVTSTVMDKTEKRFGVTGKKFTKEEVTAILEDFARKVKQDRKEELEEAYQSGRDDAIREMLENLRHGRGLVIGEIVEVEEVPEEEKEHVEQESPAEGTDAHKAPKQEEEAHAQEHEEQPTE